MVINEETIREVVRDEIAKALRLDEMALTLKDYSDKVEYIRIQIAENWCLCRYCQLYHVDSDLFAHWMSELYAHIVRIKGYNIKNNISKTRIVRRVLIDRCDFNSPEMIYRIVRDKFSDEGITNKDICMHICMDFCENVNALIEAIGNDSVSIKDYMDKTFR